MKDKELWEKLGATTKDKTRLTIRIDKDVVDWFKSYGKGYQTKMNAVLRSYYNSQKDNKND